MSKILQWNDPNYKDEKLVVYKIPKPNSSEPFLLLGSGWHVFDPEYNTRTSMKNSEILVVNPTNSEMYVTLNVVLNSTEKEKTMTVSMNNEELTRVKLLQAFQNMQIKNLILKPGVNVVALDTDEFTLAAFGLEGAEIDKWEETTVSFNVRSISIIN